MLKDEVGIPAHGNQQSLGTWGHFEPNPEYRHTLSLRPIIPGGVGTLASRVHWVLSGIPAIRANASAIGSSLLGQSAGDSLTIVATCHIDRYTHVVRAMKCVAARHLDLATIAVATRKSNPTPVPVQSTTANHRKVDSMPELTKVAVVYYSSTGTVYELADSVFWGRRPPVLTSDCLRSRSLRPRRPSPRTGAGSITHPPPRTSPSPHPTTSCGPTQSFSALPPASARSRAG